MFEVFLEVGVYAQVEGVVVGGQDGGVDGVEEGGDEVGIVDFEGEFF
jgi:hypothetical protein